MRKSTLESLLEESLKTNKNQNKVIPSHQKNFSDVEENFDTNDIDVWKKRYKSLLSDYTTLKKEMDKRVTNSVKKTVEDTIRDILPILDDINRAKEAEKLSSGMNLVIDKFQKIMASKGLKKIDTHIYSKFDPETQEVIATTPDKDMEGCVIDCVEDAYALNGEIIRYAKVVVGG